jgi:serine/threonine protein phosphatase PrpC
MVSRPVVVLWGDEHTKLGEQRVVATSDWAAAGISAGYHQKTWFYTDPNEDAVAVVAGTRATLLACADGHNGFASAREALGAILDRMYEVPAPDQLPDDDLIDLWHELGGRIRAAGQASGQPESRTTLILAIAGEGLLRWAAMGDSLLATVEPTGEVALLGERRSHFVGFPMTREEVAERLQRGLEPVDDGTWVILASDGLTDFVDDVPDSLRAATGGAPDASAAVERLIAAAFAGGAGDNVAVAALRIGCAS